MNESDAVSAGEEEHKVGMKELRELGSMSEEVFSKHGTCQKTLCHIFLGVSTFRFSLDCLFLLFKGFWKVEEKFLSDRTDRKC